MTASSSTSGSRGGELELSPEQESVRGWGSFENLPGGRTLVMGILNVTPDSFSDGGQHADRSGPVRHALDLVLAGADIIDVGGESTRPGADPVAVPTEQERVLPVIRELAARGVVMSVDTMHVETARLAVEAGAHIINDVSGERVADDMIDLVRDTGVPYILTHARGDSRSMDRRAVYEDTVEDVRAELLEWRGRFLDRGVMREQLILDPGLGFAKAGDQDWDLLAGMGRFTDMGHPVLIAASRKRFIGTLMARSREESIGKPGGNGQQVPPPSERDAATAAISALAAERGAWAVRVHDAASSRNAVDVTRKLLATEASGDAS